MDSLELARIMWKDFGLNHSFGSGMAIIENGEIVKEHGAPTNTDDLKEMPDSIVFARKNK